MNFTGILLDILILYIPTFTVLSLVQHKISWLLIGCLFTALHGISNKNQNKTGVYKVPFPPPWGGGKEIKDPRAGEGKGKKKGKEKGMEKGKEKEKEKGKEKEKEKGKEKGREKGEGKGRGKKERKRKK